jgi:hypothetical protein
MRGGAAAGLRLSWALALGTHRSEMALPSHISSVEQRSRQGMLSQNPVVVSQRVPTGHAA